MYVFALPNRCISSPSSRSIPDNVLFFKLLAYIIHTELLAYKLSHQILQGILVVNELRKYKREKKYINYKAENSLS